MDLVTDMILKAGSLIVLLLISLVPFRKVHAFLFPLFTLLLAVSVESFSLIYKYSFLFIGVIFGIFLNARFGLYKKTIKVKNLPIRKSKLIYTFVFLVICSLAIILQMDRSLFVNMHLLNAKGIVEVVTEKNILLLFVILTIPFVSFYLEIGSESEN